MPQGMFKKGERMKKKTMTKRGDQQKLQKGSAFFHHLARRPAPWHRAAELRKTLPSVATTCVLHPHRPSALLQEPLPSGPKFRRRMAHPSLAQRG
jgi:hypothetical protein